MKKIHIYIIFIAPLIGLISCIGSKSLRQNIFIGNFKEFKYDFFETFIHTTDKEFYANLPFGLKFGGIRPFPYDTLGKKDFSWIRDPDNLVIAFNTAKSIGLEKFISHKQYNRHDFDLCCHTQWEKMSLNEIVKGFLQHDTNYISNDYYSKFWKRRKKENNLKVTYDIFRQIDNYYNGKNNNKLNCNIDSVLLNLLNYDLLIAHSDTSQYDNLILDYFNYLKSVDLNYSAYKIIFHNKRITFSKEIKDSLLQTIKCDTIKKDEWLNLDDNRNGWITWENYPDPQRYYGP